MTEVHHLPSLILISDFPYPRLASTSTNLPSEMAQVVISEESESLAALLFLAVIAMTCAHSYHQAQTQQEGFHESPAFPASFSALRPPTIVAVLLRHDGGAVYTSSLCLLVHQLERHKVTRQSFNYSGNCTLTTSVMVLNWR